jgi:hypothetical protein
VGLKPHWGPVLKPVWRRADGAVFTPATLSKSVWESDVAKEEKPPEPKRLPANDEVKEVLQTIVRDVPENPNLGYSREHCGGNRKELALVDSEKNGWPKGFEPETRGYSCVQAKPDPFDPYKRVLGIQLEKLELKENKKDDEEPAIKVRILKAAAPESTKFRIGYSLKRGGKREVILLDRF